MIHHNFTQIKMYLRKQHSKTTLYIYNSLWIKLGLDEDFMPTQQTHKSELWLFFKEAKVASKRTFWRTVELFVDGT